MLRQSQVLGVLRCICAGTLSTLLGCAGGTEIVEESQFDHELTKDRGGVNGDTDYCANGGCVEGEGDCDAHSDCIPGLICGSDNGPEYGFPSGWDVCTSTCPVFDLGAPSQIFCSELCPCTVGQGDCDSDMECAADLLCRSDCGAEYGLPNTWDVCTPLCLPFDPTDPNATFCSKRCPCSLGEGDCDSDAECSAGLVCGRGNGPEFGLPATWDACSTPCPVFDPTSPNATFCTKTCPCGFGGGDCDDHSECTPGLFCGSNNGPEFGLPATWDVCTSTCPVFDPAAPSSTFCSVLCPCGPGEGDCDDHSECQPGLICGSDNGPEFGLPATWDVCTSTCPVFDPTALTFHFCSGLCPCSRGEGDCDSDLECSQGLICGVDNGPHLGLAEGYDLCRWKTQLLFWGQEAKLGVFPGNSLPAIENAYALGYDGVEIDLQLTADNRLILMHDSLLESTTNGSGVVRSMTLEEVRQYQLLPVQEPPIAIPTLEEALSVNGSRGWFLADLKKGLVASGALQVAVDTAAFDPDRLLVSAYGLDEATAIRSALPWARIVAKTYEYPAEITDDMIDGVAIAGLAGMMMELPEDVLTVAPLLSKLHERDLILVLFVHAGARTFEELEAMAAMGLDYLLTVHDEYIL